MGLLQPLLSAAVVLSRGLCCCCCCCWCVEGQAIAHAHKVEADLRLESAALEEA
eukprot:COSAG01_NODE_28443_length_661_cov_0.588968_2_plen_53_part_01